MFRKPFLHFKDFQGIVINLSTRVWGCSGMDEFRLWCDRFCDLGTEGSKRNTKNHAAIARPVSLFESALGRAQIRGVHKSDLHNFIYKLIFVYIYIFIIIYKCKVLQSWKSAVFTILAESRGSWTAYGWRFGTTHRNRLNTIVLAILQRDFANFNVFHMRQQLWQQQRKIMNINIWEYILKI